jgi:hypothetical protein
MVDDYDPDIVIFDTYNRNTAGLDENSGMDVSVAMGLAHELKMGGSRGGRSVIFIHHPNKSGNAGYRGHTSLLNDTDIMIESERFGDRETFTVAPFYTQIKSKRQKETDDFPPYWARLDTFFFLDSAGDRRLKKDGTFVTSLVITTTDDPPPDAPTSGAAPMDRSGEVLTFIRVNPGAMAGEIQAALWGKSGSHVHRYLKELMRTGMVVQRDKGYYPPESPDAPALDSPPEL